MSKRKYLSRRTMLHGAVAGGVAAVGLPLLEVMLDSHGEALASGDGLPKRFISWMFGNGFILDRFEPAATGPNWQLSEQLMPLANVKDYVNVLTGLQNPCPSNHLITHHEGMVAFSGYDLVDVFGLSSKMGGPTIDQVIAELSDGRVPINSVHLGCSRRTSVMDGGTTMFALSHKGPTEPQYPEYNPVMAWQNIFGTFQPELDDRVLRESVLDSVREDANSLKMRLGSLDQQRMDAHLESIYALEQKIQALPPVCVMPDAPTNTNEAMGVEEPLEEVNDIMNDLIAYAFSCDITRVATMLYVGGAAETVFVNLGHSTVHHNDTHNWPGAETRINDGVIFQLGQLAKLAERLQAQEDLNGGNLLDSTVIYCSSDCAEGWTHTVVRQPIILIGHAREALKYPGIHYQAKPPPGAAGSTSDALLSVLKAFDPDATSVGEGVTGSTSHITDIMA